MRCSSSFRCGGYDRPLKKGWVEVLGDRVFDTVAVLDMHRVSETLAPRAGFRKLRAPITSGHGQFWQPKFGCSHGRDVSTAA